MKLDEFLAHPSFNRYTREMSKFREEFINTGCEIFLRPSLSEECRAINWAIKISHQHHNKAPHPNIEKLIEHLSSIDDKYMFFIYPEDYSPKFLMAQSIAQNAKASYVLDNIFAEDDTKNWIAIFDFNDVKSIGMMYQIVYSNIAYSGDIYGGYKLFGRGLMYYAECLQYQGQAMRHFKGLKSGLIHFQGVPRRSDTNPMIILESRRVVQMLLRLGYFNDEYEIFYNLWKILLPFLQRMYERTKCFLSDKNNAWKDDVNQLQSQLVADGTIVSKWKSEQTLFTLVKKEYPDALFQFRPRWLEPQNLDIYIPSINVGIEYQGIQHYESIDFFGGENAFIHRQNLDNRKRHLCEENGLKLIAWPYTDEITLKLLKEKILDAK